MVATPASAKPRLAAEWLALYVAAPGVLALLTARHRWIVLAAIAGGGLLALAVYAPARDPAARQRELPAMLARAGLSLLSLVLLLGLFAQWPSFALPRERPLVWAGVLLLYGPLSALPQELLYRMLFFRRYGELFATPAARVAASAIAFGWAHVMVHRALVMPLAALAGVLLSITWLRSRSLLLVTLEHTLYGAFVFSAGIGGMFVNGTRIVSSLLR
ncbi:MAG TPA: CPBP family glutamic-type intramembrane protease [Myxococcales bacterium]|nr:CPBP family glutamic-type intramembrane protease [Myxococcales bacterium]